jgi:hypothetical protein
MNLTLSVDDEVVQEARRRAEVAGTSVNQLVREFLSDYAGKNRRNEIADLFDERSRTPRGNSNGWKFNRDEAHERA